jgi:serine/threonine protein kinase
LILGLKSVFHDLIQGLEYLHGLRIAHRDLKVQNFVLCSDTSDSSKFPVTAKWIDFNSAKKMKAEGNMCYDTEGTLNFCAPEEIFGVNDGYDVFKADLWSLGNVFYAILFGKLAFDIPGADRFNIEMELNMKIQKEEPDYENMMGSGVVWEQGLDLVKKLLVKDAGSRFGISEIKNHPFFKE